jgi:hypothetical protein
VRADNNQIAAAGIAAFDEKAGKVVLTFSFLSRSCINAGKLYIVVMLGGIFYP